MNQEELLLRTAFACMACDGSIAEEEVSLIQTMNDDSHIFGDIDVKEKLQEMLVSLRTDGNDFVKQYLHLVENEQLTEKQELEILRVAAQTIQADNVIEYSEIKFFKLIRSCMAVSDSVILENVIEIDEEYLAQDIIERNILLDSYFDNIQLDQVEILSNVIQ